MIHWLDYTGLLCQKEVVGDLIVLLTGNYECGHGVRVSKNGDVYTGQWKAGKRNGRGKLVRANGDTYEGEWKNDYPNC